MGRLLCEIKKVPLRYFIAGLIGCILLIMFSTGFYGDTENDTYSLIYVLCSRTITINSIQLWLNSLSSGGNNTWLLVLSPIFCTLPYINIFCLEIKSNIYMFGVSRESTKKYIFYKYTSCGIYSGLVIISAMMIVLLLSIFKYGFQDNEIISSQGYIVSSFISEPHTIFLILETLITYFLYAFILGVIIIFISILTLNAFTSTASTSLLLYIIGNIYSSYLGEYTRETTSALQNGLEQPDYNEYMELLFVGNWAHGMSNFKSYFNIPYISFVFFEIVFLLILYYFFDKLVRKRIFIN